ncbi:hypothetical protein FHW36_106141 [Chitinophaga polysaccharea]|uniref:Uncharacterized protein n=1 Tax=Chitinophaga polysaccharea TaxID=1293035 RepID=A0A561PLD1_9BACT|nr:hypothetical protein FHW36_106141 [Chitinophaga polysaccharea]
MPYLKAGQKYCLFTKKQSKRPINNYYDNDIGVAAY